MKTIGLLGGMSWESTALYYRIINETVRDRLGPLHSARLVLASVNFDDIERLQRAGDWDAAGRMLADHARSLERAGAQNVVMCTNTMHKVADAIAAAVSIPMLHIADPTAAAIRRANCRRVALLGTRFTMEQAFYRERLQAHGLEVLIPQDSERDEVHRIIYEELCAGRIVDRSRDEFRQTIAGLIDRGADAVILGCTEISMLVSAADCAVPLFDTVQLHATAAAEWSMATA